MCLCYCYIWFVCVLEIFGCLREFSEVGGVGLVSWLGWWFWWSGGVLLFVELGGDVVIVVENIFLNGVYEVDYCVCCKCFVVIV